MSKASVSVWVRDVEVDQEAWATRVQKNKNFGARRRRPNKLQRRKSAEIARLGQIGRERIGDLAEREFLAAGIALYAGDGAKRDGLVSFANSNARMIAFFCVWLRRFFEVDETRLRVRLYLHQGLDLEVAVAHWSEVTGIPPEQFGKAYRAVPDPSIRRTKHQFGCAHVSYSCSRIHREMMGLMDGLLASAEPSGVAQLAAQGIVNPKVAGSGPAPGAAGLGL